MRRKVIFSEGEFYHVFNKTINREIIFDGKKNLDRAIDLIDYYRYRSNMSYSRFRALNPEAMTCEWERMTSSLPLVRIHSFGLMPNHFHFLLEQVSQDGIKVFTSNFQNSFAKYFNLKRKREGSLFKSRFKGVWLQTIEEVLHESRYIHLNPVTSYLMEINQLDDYPYTSFSTYVGRQDHRFITTDLILSNFKTTEEYRSFVNDQSDYQRSLRDLRHIVLE